MRKTLPERYYLDHFYEFLAFFDGANQCLVDESAQSFIDRFKALDLHDQSLIVRAANRKYPVIARKTFQYEEIERPLERLQQLTEQGWFLSVAEADSYAISQAMVKGDLVSLLRENGAAISTSASKQQLTELLQQLMIQTPILQTSTADQLYVLRGFDDALDYLLFIYFGHTKGRLNQFSMRDLGVMRTRQDVTESLARFEHLDAAKGAFYYAQGLKSFKQLSELQKQSFSIDSQVQVHCVIGKDYRDRLLYQMGIFWLAQDHARGLAYLQQSDSDAAREKWLRESYKAGEKDAVKATLEEILTDPASDTLLAFAEDFYARKFGNKRTSLLTDMLRDATHLVELDESHNQSVEQGVIGYYRRQAEQAFRTENQLWRTLYGLFFWDWLYGEYGLISEFDRRPQVIRHNNFNTQFEHQIESHLAAYASSSETLYRYLLKQASTHYGKSNCIFMWRQGLLDKIKVFLEYSDIAIVRDFLRMMSKDYAGLRDGFPDIMVVRDDELRFEEIKAPGDQLRRNQLTTIQRLKLCGFKVYITQVKWYQDPLQPYVVVDIETTGGHAAHHRITEVGMVKLVNGEEVARWQSLVNPQRHIPSRITQLTGIDNAMVAEAPAFAEIAEDIEQFTQDCVFVAHNVNFDYGFIKQEFARLGAEYKRPKLCTCARMRQSFGGLKSYSLGALSKHFGITLENHHRALDDALAASELLKLIQNKR